LQIFEMVYAGICSARLVGPLRLASLCQHASCLMPYLSVINLTAK